MDLPRRACHGEIVKSPGLRETERKGGSWEWRGYAVSLQEEEEKMGRCLCVLLFVLLWKTKSKTVSF